jgi:hypothetical protein
MNPKITILMAAIAFVGCASPWYPVSQQIRWAYPSMGFAGQYCKQLTVDDIRQIVNLTRSRADIRKPVDQIVMEKGPDEAEVNSGNPQKTGDIGTSFRVQKRNGRWMIIEGSINTGPGIITG